MICGAAIAAMIVMSGCSTKPVQIEWGAKSQSINNALLEERYSFVPRDKKLKESNWAYEVEARAKGDYLFENNQMVKVFLSHIMLTKSLFWVKRIWLCNIAITLKQMVSLLILMCSLLIWQEA